jgi:hypothetical protein
MGMENMAEVTVGHMRSMAATTAMMAAMKKKVTKKALGK